jgi:hypothetical protein
MNRIQKNEKINLENLKKKNDWGCGGGMAVDGGVINRMSLKAREYGGENGAKISRRFGLLRTS